MNSGSRLPTESSDTTSGKLNVVLAHGGLVEDSDLHCGIQDSTNDLLVLSEKARDTEEIMTATSESPAPVDLSAVAESVVENYRVEYDGEISLTTPPEMFVTTHRRVVEEVLAGLVENALIHAGEDPTVEVSLSDS